MSKLDLVKSGDPDADDYTLLDGSCWIEVDEYVLYIVKGTEYHPGFIELHPIDGAMDVPLNFMEITGND